MLCFDFYGDFVTAYHFSYLFTHAWNLGFLVILLCTLAFYTRICIGLKVLLHKNRDEILGIKTDHWQPVQHFLLGCLLFLVAPLVLRWRYGYTAFKNRRINKKIEKISKKSDVSDAMIEVMVLQRKQIKLEARQKKLRPLLASSYSMHIWLETVPQICCQLLIVFLAAIPYPYPGVVTTIAGWWGVQPSVIFFIYLTAMEACKYGSSYLVRKGDTVSLLGTLLVYLRLHLRSGISNLEYLGRMCLMHILANQYPLFKEFGLPVLISYVVIANNSIWVVKATLAPDPTDNNSLYHVKAIKNRVEQITGTDQDWDEKVWALDKRQISRQDFQEGWNTARRDYWVSLCSIIPLLMLQFWFINSNIALFPEEIRVLFHFSPAWLLPILLCQLVLFELYNQFAHPSARLLKDV